jgi:hypothetical protein
MHKLWCPPLALGHSIRLLPTGIQTQYGLDGTILYPGVFEYLIRRIRIFEKIKNRFEFDSCEFEFELPLCDSIRANFPCENSFMDYSRKRSNIREQFVGMHCKFGLLV